MYTAIPREAQSTTSGDRPVGPRRRSWIARLCGGVFRAGGVAALLAGASVALRAQWVTQSFDLVAGWNAVYLNVDASHAAVDDLMAGSGLHPIEEIWQWNASVPGAQFVQGPAVPVTVGTPWSSWKRGQGAAAVLKRLSGNTACLVRVASGTPAYTWELRGRPVAPRYDWTTSGLNFLGFPTLPHTPPSFETFLRPAPALLNSAEIYRYGGGALGPSNPGRVHALSATPVRRGEAFWMRAGTLYNNYFGPFRLDLGVASGLDFSDSTSARSFRVRNLNASELVVRMELVNSEPAPSGQPAIAGPPPLVVRGPVDPTNLTFGYRDFSAPQSWTLKPAGQPGSEVEIVVGVNRSRMSGLPGELSAAVLRLTDSLGLTRVDLPVTATVASQAGLWVGAAAVTNVQHYLKLYAKDAAGQAALTPEGKYQVSGTNVAPGSVGRPYPLRLILHTDATGGSGRLLQRVYVGVKPDGTTGITTRENLLDPAQLAGARRISSVHLPWSAANAPWPCTGELRDGQVLTAAVTLDHADSATNPFLHTYHPDHDGLTETFDERVARGDESYEVRREIALIPAAPEDDFASLTRGHNTRGGEYVETITLTGVTKPGRAQPETRTFQVRGTFSLTRLTDIPELTTD